MMGLLRLLYTAAVIASTGNFNSGNALTEQRILLSQASPNLGERLDAEYERSRAQLERILRRRGQIKSTVSELTEASYRRGGEDHDYALSAGLYYAGKEGGDWAKPGFSELLDKQLQNDPVLATIIGRDWSTPVFSSHEFIIMERVKESPVVALNAGVQWSDDRFKRYQRTIVYSAARAAITSCKAGKDWKDDRFGPSAAEFAKTIAQHPGYSYITGRDWKRERSLPFVDKFALAVSHNSEISYFAGKAKREGEGWDDELFNATSALIVSGVVKESKWSFMAGIFWKDERFNPYGELLGKAVPKSPEYLSKARREWPVERRRFLPETK